MLWGERFRQGEIKMSVGFVGKEESKTGDDKAICNFCTVE